MNVLTEFATALAGLVLALMLLRLNFWRAVLYLFPTSARVEPEAPADQMDLPPELAPLAAQLKALGFTPLGSHEEKPRFAPATRSYNFARPAERVFATLHLGARDAPRLYFLTPLAPEGFVITADYKRPALDIPGYRSGGLEDVPPERLYRAHLKRLEGLNPTGDFSWEGRVEAGRSWYRGLGQKEIRKQNLAGLLWTVAALAIVASAFVGGRAA